MAYILALDIATRTGWALADIDTGPAPLPLLGAGRPAKADRRSGVVDLGGGDGVAGLIDRYVAWLRDWLLAEPRPAIVVFEAPFARGAATLTLFGLAAVTEWLCYRIGSTTPGGPIDVYEVAPATLKHYATGSGRAGKAAMIEAARARGWAPRDDNEADALMLADYACACLAPCRTAAA